MTVLLWLLLLFVGFVAVLASSAKLRKSAFIWFSYVTITGWYYFRLLHKKYASNNTKTKSTASSMSNSKAGLTTKEADLVYLESSESIEGRQQDWLNRSGASERSSRTSDSGSSGSDVGTTGFSKHKRRLFHSRRKAAAEEAMRRVSRANSTNVLMSSGVSEAPSSTRNSATRRTYSGRKKPVSWAD